MNRMYASERLDSPPEVGKNPFKILENESSAPQNQKSFDKTVDLCVKACPLILSVNSMKPMTKVPNFFMNSPDTLNPNLQALTNEESFGIFRVARAVLEPFRELCLQLVPRLHPGSSLLSRDDM